MSCDGIDNVVGKRGLFVCRFESICLLQRLKGSTSSDACDFNNMETRAVIKFYFFARQGAEGNSHHSDRNIRGTCTIVCHRQKIGWPPLNVVIFPPVMRLVLETQNSDHPGDY